MSPIDLAAIGIVIVAVVAMIIQRTTKAREREEAWEEAVVEFSTPVKNIKIAVCSLLGIYFVPVTSERDLIVDVHRLANIAWPEYADRLGSWEILVWFVRSPEQLVAWRAALSIPWKDIPVANGIPESAPGQGYGGMCDNKMIYVATFHPGRDPYLLYIHELTHCITRVSDHSSEVFISHEKSLANAWREDQA